MLFSFIYYLVDNVSIIFQKCLGYNLIHVMDIEYLDTCGVLLALCFEPWNNGIKIGIITCE